MLLDLLTIISTVALPRHPASFGTISGLTWINGGPHEHSNPFEGRPDVKAVHGDVTALLHAGMIERTVPDVVFGNHAVHVDFKLTKAA